MHLNSIALATVTRRAGHRQIPKVFFKPLALAGTRKLVLIASDTVLNGGLEADLRNEFSVNTFRTCEAFLKSGEPEGVVCLIVQASMPHMDGLELLTRYQSEVNPLPFILIGRHNDVASAVRAMKAGAADFLESPVHREVLRASIEAVVKTAGALNELGASQAEAAARIAKLTQRQHQIFDLILAGNPSKIIAADLGISQRTVENHRSEIMKKTGSRSIPALVQNAYSAGLYGKGSRAVLMAAASA